jgi:hypothetical protein
MQQLCRHPIIGCMHDPITCFQWSICRGYDCMAMIFEFSFGYVILSFTCGLLIQTWVHMAHKLFFNTHKCDNVYAHIPQGVEF